MAKVPTELMERRMEGFLGALLAQVLRAQRLGCELRVAFGVGPRGGKGRRVKGEG